MSRSSDEGITFDSQKLRLSFILLTDSKDFYMSTDVYVNMEIYVKIRYIVNEGCHDVFPPTRLNKTASVNLEREIVLFCERLLFWWEKGQVAYAFLYWQFKGDSET